MALLCSRQQCRRAPPARLQALDEDVDLAAARQSDGPPGFPVADPVREQLRLAAREHLLRLLEDVSLDVQPPETEPQSLPDAVIARLDPTGRGAVRRFATTVATTTSSPSCCQRSISPRTLHREARLFDHGSGKRESPPLAAPAAARADALARAPGGRCRQRRSGVEARRLLGRMDFTEAQRHHVEGLIDRWEEGR